MEDEPGPADDHPRLARRRVRRGRRDQATPTRSPTAPTVPAAAPRATHPAEPSAESRYTTAQPARTHTGSGGSPAPSAAPAPAPAPASQGTGRVDRPERGERGLRGLIGSGPSQVGISGALRARDASRPTAADLAAADAELVIVRRHYVPPDRLPGRSPAPGDAPA